MATLKQKSKAAETEAVSKEDIVTEPVQEIEQTDDEVYELLAGYQDEDGVIHKEFVLREMTGKDEEAIHKSDVKNNTSKVVSTLLSRCTLRIGSLTPKSVGGMRNWESLIKKLYVGDQDYMLLQLRKMSVGDEIEVNHVCPNKDCKAKLKTVLSIDELEIIPFPGVREVPFELPRGYRDKKSVKHTSGVLKLPTGFDREVLTPLAKTNLARAETVMLTRLARFSDGLPVDEDVMGNLSVRDREYLQKLLQNNYFGVKLDMEVTCDTCGETFIGSFNAANFM